MKDLVKDYEMENNSGIGLYVGTYKKYNEGSLYGMWVDLEKVYDAEEFFEVCAKLHDDEDGDAEYMFQDFQGFPEEFYSESMNEEEIQRIIDFINLDEDEQELLEDYCEIQCESIGDFQDFMDRAKDSWMGKYSDFREFTDQMADEQISCFSLGKDTEFFERYFDYDKWENDMDYDYAIGSNGNVFNTSY